MVEGKLVLGVMGCPCLTHANMAKSMSGKRMIWSLDKITKRGKLPSMGNDGVLMAAYNGLGSWVKPLDFEATQANKVLVGQKFVQSLVDGSLMFDNAWFGLSRHEYWDLSPLARIVDPNHARNEDFALPFCCGSLCKYLAVAIGAVSVVLLPQTKRFVKVWDHAAGVICVLEAGGKVTDGEGADIENFLCKGHRTFAPGGGIILVTNGHLHKITLRGLSKQTP